MHYLICRTCQDEDSAVALKYIKYNKSSILKKVWIYNRSASVCVNVYQQEKSRKNHNVKDDWLQLQEEK